MRCQFVHVAGFRGVRDELQLEFPPGFTVVTGRNGAGKSTIFDAIEYALIGHLRRQSEQTERSERIEDYIWWRGERPAERRFVTVGFVSDDGEEFVVTRTPEGLASTVAFERLRDALVTPGAPEDHLERLIMASVIRDEKITELSIDLAETERFRFVRGAIGDSRLEDYADRLKKTCALLKSKKESREHEYAEIRDTIRSILEKIARLQAELGSEQDLREAWERIAEATDAEVANDLSAARHFLVQMEEDRSDLENQTNRLTEAVAALRHSQSDEALAQREEERRLAVELSGELESLLEAESDSVARIDELRPSAGESSETAELLRLGRDLGRNEGECPLCGSEISEGEFRSHIHEALAEVNQRAREVVETERRLTTLRQTIEEKREALHGLEASVENAEQERVKLRTMVEEVEKELSRRGVDPPTVEGARTALEELSTRITRLREDIRLVESTSKTEEIEELKADLEQARSEAEATSEAVATAEKALGAAQRARRELRRLEGEVIEERLASIGPLLEEIYSRLKPHVDWRHVRYHLRGDVRRFLSLEVGDQLNPNFMFSSGQRRAMGIAFLTAVHLSTAWSRLRTIMLDDPVQHIDDFRALHLVELLQAIRKGGRQVIVSAEDPALAELAVRRLRGIGNAEGALVQMEYVAGDGVRVSKTRRIPRETPTILRSA